MKTEFSVGFNKKVQISNSVVKTRGTFIDTLTFARQLIFTSVMEGQNTT